MGRIKFKFYYPEFSNVFLSLYALSGIDQSFGKSYLNFFKTQERQLDGEDQKQLQIFQQEVERLTEDRAGLNKFLEIIIDHNVENLIMLKRRVEKEFGEFDLTEIDRVYLYFYSRLVKDYKLFQIPIITVLKRLEKQLKDEKITYHLEKFHKFLKEEKRIKIDQHFFLTCYYFGRGRDATFIRILPNRILFYLPILISEGGKVSFDFDEKAFLEQIFFQTLSLQFEGQKNKFDSLITKYQLNETHFRGAVVGAVHYGIYSFDVFREALKLEKITNHLERKMIKSQINKDQVSLAISLTPLIERFYADRKGLGEDFLDEVSKIFEKGEEPESLKKIVSAKEKKRKIKEERKGVIFES